MANEEHLKILKEGPEIWNKWRKDHDEVPDLTGADLNHTILKDANLNLAFLKDANLHNAILTGAHLSYANLHNANLSRAHLSYANLSETLLSGTDLSFANLHNANLSRALIHDSVFTDLDLSEVQGLATCRHLGASSVDHRTLEKSGRLPLEFLRGVGFSDRYIECIPSLFGKGIVYSAFLSHNSGDKDFVRHLHSRLQGEGVRCWFDEKQILAGDDLYDEIDRGVQIWDKFVLVCSKESLSSWWVEHEWKKAMEKERRLRKERGEKILTIIPIDIDGFIHTDECKISIKSEILSRAVADFTGWKEHDAFETALNGLMNAFRTNRMPDPEPKL